MKNIYEKIQKNNQIFEKKMIKKYYQLIVFIIIKSFSLKEELIIFLKKKNLDENVNEQNILVIQRI